MFFHQVKMDWNTREKVLGYFVDFVVGEIDEIENIISWADARNHPETAMNKIRQIVVARQEVAIYARDVLMEQTKLPDRWALAADDVRFLPEVIDSPVPTCIEWAANSACPEAPVCGNRALHDAQSTACGRGITLYAPNS